VAGNQRSKDNNRLSHSVDLARFVEFLLGKECARAFRDGTRKQRDVLRTLPFDQEQAERTQAATSEMPDLIDFIKFVYAEMEPNRKAAVHLHLFEHLDISEVAKRLDCHPRSIMRYLKEFRERFREKWEG
jgi:DNA-directed RNA polymerase specialized sigma24 family protein